jgi:spore coat protein CotF
MLNKPSLTEEDMASSILADLKRVTREYATAATESVCPEVRQMFTQLLNNTLTMQGELFTAMQQNNMYNASSPALKQEVDKQIKQYQQTQQKTTQFVQQTQAAQSQIPPGATGNNSIPAYQ